MSKRTNSGEKIKSKKYACLTGYCDKTTPDILKKLKSHPHKGDWRSHRQVRVAVKRCSIKWTYTGKEKNLLHVLKTPVPVGMTGLVEKNQTASGRSWESLPLSVKEAFQLEDKANFIPEDVKVEVGFSGNCFLS